MTTPSSNRKCMTIRHCPRCAGKCDCACHRKKTTIQEEGEGWEKEMMFKVCDLFGIKSWTEGAQNELVKHVSKVRQSAIQEERERLAEEVEGLKAEYQVPVNKGGYRKYIREISTHAIDRTLSLIRSLK